MRYFAILLFVVFFSACSSPRREAAEQEKSVYKELEAQEQPGEYKDPDGAFGAKDFAGEARESSDRNTQALESAMEENQSQADEP